MATVIDRPSPARARDRWRYRDDGGRDRRLDLLRGYALAAMAVNHFGLSQSYVHELSGRSSFLISAAEAFLFISGFTLGFISVSRGDTAADRLRSRTWIVYLATIGISLGLSIVALRTHLGLWGDFEAANHENVWQWIGQVLTMKAAFNGADILIAYVLYLGVGVAALRLMAAGRTWVVVLTVGALYGLSQLSGAEAVSLGFASFRTLVPNAPLFFGGLVLGYHRRAVADWWRTVRWRRSADVATIAIAVGLAWLHASEFASWPGLGEWINGSDVTEPLWRREESMPVPALLVVGLYLRVAWLVVDALWVPLRRTLGWLLLPLGEASLFTFVAHLLAIPLVTNLAFWPGEELGRVRASAWVLAYLGVILVAVLVRRSVLLWLRRGGPARDRVRSHGPVVAVGALLVGLLVASVSPSGAAGAWAGDVDADDRDIDDIESLEDEVGQIVDLVDAGELEVAEAVALLPPEIPTPDRERIASLLEIDPYVAEGLIVELLIDE